MKTSLKASGLSDPMRPEEVFLMDDAALATGLQASSPVASALRQRLATFLAPLLVPLDAALDRRLVCTFAASIDAMIATAPTVCC
jgi:hypothetical protein